MATCTADLKVKMTPQEKKALAELAAEAGATMGGWLRAQIRQQAEVQAA